MSTDSVKIGVLDIQGSVEEHLASLRKLGAAVRAVKTKEDLDEVDGLILPGGESTTIGKLLKKYGLDRAIRGRASSTARPLALWGTCAGAILLAKKVTNRPPHGLKLMNISIARNAYGRQADSFQTEISAPRLGTKPVPAIFIRAPMIEKTSPHVEVLAQYGGHPIMVREENLLATAFHPELTDDLRVHRYFISLTREICKKSKRPWQN